MAKKAKIQKELTGAQDLYNYLYEACNKLRGPVSQDNFKEYITPLLYYNVSAMFIRRKRKRL